MQAVRWSEEMSLGVPGMDQAHKAFLAQLECLANAPDEQFAAAYLELIVTLEQDFREEESLMAKIRYPGLRRHSEQHARVLEGLRHAEADVLQGDMAAGRDVIGFLPRWFLGHLRSMDLSLAVALEMSGEHHQPPPDVFLRAELSRQLNMNMME